VAQGFAQELLIAVHNRGPAISPEQLPRIFHAGARGTGTSGDRRHLGLGLYIVDKIVVAHGGNIAVTSTAESGTSFTIRIPRTMGMPAAGAPRPIASA
jgi:signal transduction histidine kinase